MPLPLPPGWPAEPPVPRLGPPQRKQERAARKVQDDAAAFMLASRLFEVIRQHDFNPRHLRLLADQSDAG